MEGRRHAYARHTRYSIQHRHCGTGGHPRRGRVPRPDRHRYRFGGRMEPGSCRGAGRGLTGFTAIPTTSSSGRLVSAPPDSHCRAIARRSTCRQHSGGASTQIPAVDDDNLPVRDLACCAGRMAFYSTPSDLVRFALATNAYSVNGELGRRKRDVADDAPRQRDRRCRGIEHRARQHGRSRAKSG